MASRKADRSPPRKAIPETPTTEVSRLTHNPFAGLSSRAASPSATTPDDAAPAAPSGALPPRPSGALPPGPSGALPPGPSGALPPRPPDVLPSRPSGALPSRPPEGSSQKRSTAAKLTFRLESKGRGGRVATRIAGLPSENLDAIAARLRQALGCGAVVEGADVVLLGSLIERASQWLDRAGDLRAIVNERKAHRGDERAPAPLPPSTSLPAVAGELDGHKRGDVRPGQRVAIVQKADQPTGQLTEGVVHSLLTSSAWHPHGIKVRLETGEVGRVKVIYG